MDKIYILQGVEFEWDEEKNALNVQKHDVTFEEAAEVFFDPYTTPRSRRKNVII